MRPQNSPHAGDAKPNRLIQEKSPYLLQHAYNPVDWYAWGDEAFEAARRQNKPIFLSIGYSTCHWCHVMERESFERPEVAREMNEAFVSIKVDREERPDIDNVYMRVCQMVTGSGGWPLTIVMTPDKKPFFAGTYIPPGDRFGRAGMLTLIPRIREAWTDRRDDVERSAEEIVEALEQASSASTPGALTAATLDAAYEELSARFDARFGGFGMAPKFPTPHNLLFLLRYAKRTGDARGLNMVERTLTAMRQGGIYDHVGFGFHRYSTDAEWLVPHFEKMLYDQALLALAYTEAFQVTNRQDYASAAREILAYTSRALTDAEGGFYSAEDADSEGVEGKFYLWTEAELREVLDHDDAEFVIRVFNVHRDGNFSDPMGGEGGENILYISKSPAELALELGVMAPELTRRWGAIREKLFAVREARGHPHRDDKVLADWNGLMVAAYAKAARALREPSLAEPARRAADFVLSRMRAQDGGLLHRWRDGEAAVAGHLDDYAFMILGLTELYETTFDPGLLRTALELNEHALKEFWDDERGGFFFTAANREQVLVRSKEIYDGAVPSGNSVQMLNLLRLAHLTGQTELAEKADHLGRAFAASIAHSPAAYTFWMVALDFALGPTSETVIAGDPHAEDTRAMLDALAGTFFPRAVTLLVPNDGRAEDLARIAGFTRSMKSAGGPALAYVCRDFHCNLPTKDPEQMLRLLTAL